MVTELEMMGAKFAGGERYLLRYHQTAGAERKIFDMSVPDASMSWSGFRYRDNQVSILLLRQGRSLAAA